MSGINDWVEKVLKKKKLEMKKLWHIQSSHMNETDNSYDLKQSNNVVDQPGKFKILASFSFYLFLLFKRLRISEKVSKG